MTGFRGPGVRQIGTVGTTPKEHRLAIAGQYAENAPGVPRSGLLVQASTNVVALTGDTGTLAYAIGPLAAVINREIDDGVYTPTATGSNKVATTAAPASGSRWDLIWCRQNDAEKGDKLPVVGGAPDNSFIFGVVQGASAGTPTKPTAQVPAGALALAEARIFSGTTSTLQSPNTITPVYPITAARGAPIPVRNQAERDALGKWAGLQALRLDKSGAIDSCTGTKWVDADEVIEASAADTNWAYAVRLSRQSSTDGLQAVVTMNFYISRKAGAPAMTIPTTVIQLLEPLIPVGWRPTLPIPGAGVVSGSSYGSIMLTPKADGAIDARSTGGAIPISANSIVAATIGWIL